MDACLHWHTAPDPGPSTALQTGDIVDQVQVDAEGRFELHVSQGTWTLSAYDPQGQRGEMKLAIEDEDAPAQLHLV